MLKQDYIYHLFNLGSGNKKLPNENSLDEKNPAHQQQILFVHCASAVSHSKLKML